jgi:hypothetical protein
LRDSRTPVSSLVLRTQLEDLSHERSREPSFTMTISRSVSAAIERHRMRFGELQRRLALYTG